MRDMAENSVDFFLVIGADLFKSQDEEWGFVFWYVGLLTVKTKHTYTANIPHRTSWTGFYVCARLSCQWIVQSFSCPDTHGDLGDC